MREQPQRIQPVNDENQIGLGDPYADNIDQPTTGVVRIRKGTPRIKELRRLRSLERLDEDHHKDRC